MSEADNTLVTHDIYSHDNIYTWILSEGQQMYVRIQVYNNRIRAMRIYRGDKLESVLGPIDMFNLCLALDRMRNITQSQE